MDLRKEIQGVLQKREIEGQSELALGFILGVEKGDGKGHFLEKTSDFCIFLRPIKQLKRHINRIFPLPGLINPFIGLHLALNRIFDFSFEFADLRFDQIDLSKS